MCISTLLHHRGCFTAEEQREGSKGGLVGGVTTAEKGSKGRLLGRVTAAEKGIKG